MQCRAGDVARLGRREKSNGIRDILRRAQPAQRYLFDELLSLRLRKRACHIGIDKARRNTIDGDCAASNFLRAIAPPATDDDKKFGYSLGNARDWLGRYHGTKFVVGEETEFAGVMVVRGRAESGNKREAFALRITPGPQKEADGFGGCRIDWLHRSERGPIPSLAWLCPECGLSLHYLTRRVAQPDLIRC